MPDTFKVNNDSTDIFDVIKSYRNYYVFKKETIFRWKYTNRKEPDWLIQKG